MDSFDQSLKYLLQQEPADFVRFALDDVTAQVIGPVPSGLPSRGRDVDGAYFVERGRDRMVAHFEFHRRHQAETDLAIDVGEAQIRFYRRDRLDVVSLVWDLYGTAGEPVLDERCLVFGSQHLERTSRIGYLRVNLRGLSWQALLAKAPPALWPLVTLADGGACEDAVHEARDAIEARTDITPAERADHLAVLWFIAEAESVPVRVMRAYISEEELMASTLYESIFEKGEARKCADAIIKILTSYLGALDPSIETRIRSVSHIATLDAWLDEAVTVRDATSARRFVEKIAQASVS